MTPAESTITGILADIPPAYHHLIVAVLAYEAAGSNTAAGEMLGLSGRSIRRHRADYRDWIRERLSATPPEKYFVHIGADTNPAQH